MKNTFKIMLCLIGLQSFSAFANNIPQTGYAAVYDQTTAYYLQQAASSSSPRTQANAKLNAAGRTLQDGNLAQAQQILASLNTTQLTPQQATQQKLLQAKLALLQHHPEQALGMLGQIANPNSQSTDIQVAYYQLNAAADATVGNNLANAEDLINMDPLLSPAEQPANRQAIWQALQQVKADDLNAQLRFSSNDIQHGWLELAYDMKSYQNDPTTLSNALQDWQQQYPNHPASYLLPASPTPASTTPVSTATSSASTGQIALIIPQTGSLAYVGQAIQSGMSISQNSSSAYTIKPYDETLNINATYAQAQQDGATAVIGPFTKPDVARLALMRHLPLPTLALNVLGVPAQNTQLYQFGLSPQDEATQVADKASGDGHKHALIIAPTGEWGSGVVNAFRNRWQTDGGIITDEFDYTDSSSLDPGIQKLLKITPGAHPQGPVEHRKDMDVIFLLADPATARQIKQLFKFYYADNIPMYATSMVYTGTPDTANDAALNGIIFCDIPFVLQNTATMQAIRTQMQQSMPDAAGQSARLFAFGYDAYQILPLLSQLGHTPTQGYAGLTGLLYIGDNQQIMRQLPWAVFRNGQPQLLP